MPGRTHGDTDFTRTWRGGNADTLIVYNKVGLTEGTIEIDAAWLIKRRCEKGLLAAGNHHPRTTWCSSHPGDPRQRNCQQKQDNQPVASRHETPGSFHGVTW
jgi:hypothetical protein